MTYPLGRPDWLRHNAVSFSIWDRIYNNLYLVPLIPGTKQPVYTASNPKNGFDRKLSLGFKTQADWLLADSKKILTPNTNAWVLNKWWRDGFNVGLLTGRQREGRVLYVQDFDLKNMFGGSIAGAREWRKSHIKELQGFRTLVTLTASGGVHLFFYSNSLDAVNACVRRRSREQGLDWLDARDLTRAEAEFKEVIVVPPSTFESRRYNFLDSGRTPILDVSGEPVAEDLKLGPKESDPVADFLSFSDSRRKL